MSAVFGARDVGLRVEVKEDSSPVLAQARYVVSMVFIGIGDALHEIWSHWFDSE